MEKAHAEKHYADLSKPFFGDLVDYMLRPRRVHGLGRQGGCQDRPQDHRRHQPSVRPGTTRGRVLFRPPLSRSRSAANVLFRSRAATRR